LKKCNYVCRKPLFPFVTVDVALFTIEEQRVKVLLVKREVEPFAGSVDGLAFSDLWRG